MVCRVCYGDARGVSELYGSVLMISIALLTSLILLGLGTAVLDQVSSDTEDAITQDAMLEMDDRLTTIAGSGPDATTTFMIPEGGDGDLSVQPDHGVVNVSVQAEASGDELLYTDETSNSTEIELGTIRYVHSNDHITAYQGGAVFSHQDGYTEVLSRPAFNFDGEQIDFSFFNISNLDSIRADTDVSATMVADDSRSSSEGLQEWLNQYWLVGSDGVAHSVSPVRINVTIKSAFADGWGLYALEGMQEEPEAVHIEDDRVTMEFYLGGEPDMTTSPDDWEEALEDGTQSHFVYSGLSQFAQYSTHLDPVDGGPAFQFNHTNVNPSEEFVALYHYKPDGPNGWVGFDGDGDEEWVGMFDYEEHFDPDEDQDELAVVEHPDDIAPGVRERPDRDGHMFHIESDNPVCAAGASYMSSEGHFENDCLKYMFQVPNNDTEALIDSTEWMITGVELDNSQAEYEEGDTLSADVTIENQGQESNAQYIQLRNLDGEIVDVEQSSVLDPGEDEVRTLEWEIQEGDAGDDDPRTGTLEVSTEDVITTVPDPDHSPGGHSEVTIYQGDREAPDCGTLTIDNEISSLEELQCIGEGINLDNDFVLTENIDATVTGEWNDGDGFEPIGEMGAPFTGSFDGQGHQIEGLHIDRGGSVGLFGVTGDGAGIENVDVVDAEIHGHSVAGGLIGSASGPVEKVSVTGTVEATTGAAGGIIGEMDDSATLSVAYSTADVTGDVAGGIVGATSDADHEFDQLYWAGGSLTGSHEGAIIGEASGDETLTDSVYWENQLGITSTGDGSADVDDSTGLPEDDMTGEDADEEMSNLDWNEFQTTPEFPAFERGFIVDGEVDDDTIIEGEEFEVAAAVTNFYTTTKTQDILLLNTRGHTVDRETVMLGPEESASFELTWDTQWRDADYDDNPIVVLSDDDSESIAVNINEGDPVDSIDRIVGDSDLPISVRTTEIVIE